MSKTEPRDPLQIYYDRYSRSAERRHLVLALDLDSFAVLTGMPCHFCDCDPLTPILDRSTNKFEYFQSLDRKDRNDDYTESNTIPCCVACSQSRGTLSYDQFIAKRKRQAQLS